MRVVLSMSKYAFRTAEKIGLIAGTALLVTLAGCVTEQSNQRRGYGDRSSARMQATVAAYDYDYYPAYEVYYSRSRAEYTYRQNNRWVRRHEPQGISVEVLFSSPSVRLEYRDSPERYHRQVVRTYPRNWSPPTQAHNERDDRNGNHRRDGDRGN